MIWLILALQMATLGGLAWRWWRARRALVSAAEPSDDEMEAQAFLATTVERFLHELQDSADRATRQLREQTGALEALLSQADDRLARLPDARPVAAGAAAPRGAAPGWPEQAHALATEGLAVRQIARRLGRGETEIRLVLSESHAS